MSTAKSQATGQIKKLSEQTPTALKGAHAKIGWVQAKVAELVKSGTVHFGQTEYRHFIEHDVYLALQELLDQAHLATILDELASEQDGNMTRATFALSVIDADLPRDDPNAAVTARFTSHGVDSSDKGSNKAFTNAAKYLYQKTFRIPTIEAEDVEGSDEAHNQPAEKSNGTKTITKKHADELRAAAQAAIEEDLTTPNRVTAYLQAEFGTAKVADLNKKQAGEFSDWLKDEIAE